MSDSTEYKVKLVSSEEIPAADELIAGSDYVASGITVSASGSLKRGTLLMSSEGGFVPSTAEGVKSAELSILSDDIEVPEGSTVEAAGYFRGTFSGAAIIVPYEGDEDNHKEVIEGLRAVLRKQGIFVV